MAQNFVLTLCIMIYTALYHIIKNEVEKNGEFSY